MQVPYEVRVSEGKGCGLYPIMAVPRYTLIWQFTRANVSAYTEAQARVLVAGMADSELGNLLKYAYWNEGELIDIRQVTHLFFRETLWIMPQHAAEPALRMPL